MGASAKIMQRADEQRIARQVERQVDLASELADVNIAISFNARADEMNWGAVRHLCGLKTHHKKSVSAEITEYAEYPVDFAQKLATLKRCGVYVAIDDMSVNTGDIGFEELSIFTKGLFVGGRTLGVEKKGGNHNNIVQALSLDFDEIKLNQKYSVALLA